MTEKKQSKTFYINNDLDRSKAMTVISKLSLEGENHYSMKISTDNESRSDKQNRLSFMWYQILGSLTGHGKKHERATCKLHYGIPILRRDDAEFNVFYKQALINLTYEQKLQAMEYLPVTSLMSVKQFAEYLNTVDQESATKGHILPHPEDIYYEALIKEYPNAK